MVFSWEHIRSQILLLLRRGFYVHTSVARVPLAVAPEPQHSSNVMPQSTGVAGPNLGTIVGRRTARRAFHRSGWRGAPSAAVEPSTRLSTCPVANPTPTRS